MKKKMSHKYKTPKVARAKAGVSKSKKGETNIKLHQGEIKTMGGYPKGYSKLR